MAGSRSALIVATYQHDDPGLTRLRAPAQDAEALAEILSDPDVGGFDVSTVVNGSSHDLTLAVATFFRDRRADDLLLLHFSCHGLKDDSGELYFAASDTRLDLLEATGVASSYVNRVMDRSRAGQVLLLLDCCYAGAFARAGAHRAAGAVDIGDRLGGRGRVVITASSALEYAFEGQELTTVDGSPSVFTGALVRGLRSGEADRDQDGWVSLDELYGYVYDEVRRLNPHQTPKKWAFDMEGDVYVARRGGPVTVPSELPAEVRQSMTSLLTWERESAVAPLRELLVGSHPGRALGARMALQEMATRDDSDRVRTAARAALASAPGAAVEVIPPRPAEVGVVREDAAPVADEGPATVPTPAAEVEEVEEAEEAGRNEAPEETTPAMPEPRPNPIVRRIRSWRAAVVRPGLLRWAAIGVIVVLVAGISGWVWQQVRSGGGGAETGTYLPASKIVVGGAPHGLQVVDAYGAGAPSTIPGTEGAQLPSISPNRRWIAYQAPAGDAGLNASRLVRPNGADNHALLTGSAAARCPYTTRPAWSPDGKQVAFACLVGKNASAGLFVYPVAGGNLQQVVPAHPLSTDQTAQVLGPPTWNGPKRIVFDVEVDPSTHVRHLYVTNLPPDAAVQPLFPAATGVDDEFPRSGAMGVVFRRAVPHEPMQLMLKTPLSVAPRTVFVAPAGTRLGPPGWGPKSGELVWPVIYPTSQRSALRRGVVPSQGPVTPDPQWAPTFDGTQVAPAWGRVSVRP